MPTREFVADAAKPTVSGKWESTERMHFLCALACGERIAVAAGRWLVVTNRGDPLTGCVIADADLAALERRRWVRMAGDAETAAPTYAGRMAARAWFKKQYGGVLARVWVRDEVTPLLAAEAAASKQGG